MTETITLAPSGKIWVCGACGKRSRNKYGRYGESNPGTDYGWDASCMTHAVLCDEASLVIENGRVVQTTQSSTA